MPKRHYEANDKSKEIKKPDTSRLLYAPKTEKSENSKEDQTPKFTKVNLNRPEETKLPEKKETSEKPANPEPVTTSKPEPIPIDESIPEEDMMMKLFGFSEFNTTKVTKSTFFKHRV